MSDGTNILDVGKLAKPATVLIEKICSAVGVLFEPVQIKRVARAQAEADKIRALGQVEVSEIERRGLARMIQEEARSQANIESIAASAALLVRPDADPSRMEEDWIAAFFRECRHISNEQMQSLWASILAGEANKPGAFSIRTIRIVSGLKKSDADAFAALCSFMLESMRHAFRFPIIFDPNDRLYIENGVTFGSLTHLATIGLVSFSELAGYVLHDFSPEDRFEYFGKRLGFRLTDPAMKSVPLGRVMLTEAGKELAGVGCATENPQFLDYLTQQYHRRSILIDRDQ